MDDALTPERPSDSAHPEGEWGRSSTDERFRLVISGIFHLPWGLTLAPVYEYGSGRPWTRLAGWDLNNDSAFDDRRPGVDRNDQDGPPFRQLSLRLTKAVALGRRGHLDIILEAFNVFDTTNYDVNSVYNAEYYLDPVTLQPVANPDLGTYSATLPPREIQLGLRYAF